MTKQEAMQVLALLREAYPQGAEITGATVSLWADLFSDTPYEVAWEAAKEVCRTWEGYTMPPPAELFKVIRNADGRTRTLMEKWRKVEKLIKRGTRLTQEDFDELDEDIKAYYGGVSALRDLALLDMSELPNERARFLKHMPAVQERLETQKRIPANVQAMLSGMLKQIGGGTDADWQTETNEARHGLPVDGRER